jgi:hypothetical protein
MMTFARKQFQDQSQKKPKVMKKYGVIVILYFLMLNSAWAKLRNGYEKDIHYVRESLKNYNDILITNENLSSAERRKIKSRIDNLIVYQSHFELTEELLNQFKRISPDLYHSIDSIRDARGRFTDVYVKFIPRENASIMAAGITRMAQSDEDDDACFSEYGKHSVSVTVWIFSKSLHVLSHELGHVGYQVPHLSTYTEYYKNEYVPAFTESNYRGHTSNDPSGKSALSFEREFRKDYFNYLKYRNNGVPMASPGVLVVEIKRKVNDERY